MGRSLKEQRDALSEYRRKLAAPQRTGESAQDQYKRLAEDYKKKVWKEANRG